MFQGTAYEKRLISDGVASKQAGRKSLSLTIPVLSSVMGSLIPPELFKFIPLAVLEDLVIEFKLNQYFLFNWGY